MARDLALEAHKAWLGFVQPVGMVVSPAALLAAQVILDENAAPLQRALRAFLERTFKPDRHGDLPEDIHIPDFPAFTREILGWEPGDLAGAPGGPPLPDELTVVLPEFEDRLTPTFAVPDPDQPGSWLLLLQTLFPGTALDRPHPGLHERAWKTSPQIRFERLLRERQIPVGLLSNGTHLRLVYAPRGEASGHITFPLQPMLETAGRPILAALRMLLDPARLFQGDPRSRLLPLLESSRKFQNEVSEQLSEQALLALYELLRGFNAADEASQGKLLRGVLPEDIYGGLLTVLLRLVFLLYAEEREVAAQGPLYGSSYALTTLHERLRADRGLHPDTMGQRFGAWSWLLTLFRMVHHGVDGSTSPPQPPSPSMGRGEAEQRLSSPSPSMGRGPGGEVSLHMPPRYGDLFDPERYTFLEGRVREATQQDEGFYRRLSSVPRLSDGVVLRVLDNLMFLDGERISYRTLDVEHLGSVYENMMGFTVERAAGSSIAVTPQHVVIDLDQLLAAKPAERAKWLKDKARCELAGKPAEALKKARTVPELLTALDRRLSPRTPHVLHPGSLFLQPTEERRRSGSHYTPPELTRPIVQKTLRPILERLGETSPPGHRAGETSPPGHRAGETSPPGPLPIDGEGEEQRSERGVTGRAKVSEEMLRRAKEMRRLPTPAEAAVWELLRDRRCLGLKFRRQQVVEGFILDFYCAEHRIALEIDGGIHDEQRQYDEIRTRVLASHGIHVFRVRNEDVSEPTLLRLLSPLSSSLSSPSPSMGRGPGGEVSPNAILALKVCDPAMGSGAFLVEVCRQLGDALVAAWTRFPDQRPPIPADEQEVTVARRLVAQRCLHGVDKNPFAVALAKLSLWLVTLSRELPFTFLDHALQHGDSLVGLSPEQIACVQWVLDEKPSLLRREVDGAVQQALRLRLEIQALAQGGRYHEQRDLLDRTELATARVRAIGDATVACFFGATTDKARGKDAEQLRDALFTSLDASFGRAAAMAQDLREGTLPVDGKGATIHKLPPFHWELVFPEVFHRPNPGFDAIVGNPPFAGKNTIIDGSPGGYVTWLQGLHPEAHGNADLVAHFFRRAFSLLRSGGAFGLVATNTIAQGDTRSTGLRWICNHGGVIYDATRRVKWPGRAAVIVSVVHVGKTSPPGHPAGETSPPGPLPIDGEGEERGKPAGKPRKTHKRHDTTPLLPLHASAPPPPHRWGGGWGVRFLDHRPVPQITAYLYDKGTSDDPRPLRSNENKSFQGSIVLGMGFTFDDSNPDATPIAEMHRLLAKDPRNAERIFPYLGGEELNSSPTQSHRRYVINFGQMSEDEARQWPDLMDIVERKVKPEREKLADNPDGRRRRQYWWQWGRYTPALYEAIRPLKRVLACSLVSKHLSFSWLDSTHVFSHKLAVISSAQGSVFAVLQCGVHEQFARFFSSTMKDDLNYSPSNCFETFPFPWVGWPTEEEVAEGGRWHGLEQVGEEYHRYRAELMKANDEGLTDTYNRFHDPEETSPEIQQLRELHARMDRAVLDAYGWTDIPTDCAFLLDHQDEEEDEDDGKKRRKKKPWRYRWPDEVRDEVLARLLGLNLRRSEEERLGLPGGGRR